MHEIYQLFGDDLEARGVFFYIFKAFDKVWHDSLIYKLRQNGVIGKVLIILTNFLKPGK